MGATLLIEDDRDGKKMLDLREDTDETDSERVRLDGVSKELATDGVEAIGMPVDLLIGVGVEPPSLDSTSTTPYWLASLSPTLGRRIDES